MHKLHKSLPKSVCNKTLIPRIPAGRNGTPRDFGAAVCYLASEEAGFMTGQVLRLNGGMYMG
ncbi:SDR family oxidoreductase [Enterocloster citroniae]|uniref:SDR family oxidoreductase n=1 Tax=Enterocloster citroniae TaxID=358743 RepID=UPI0032C16C9F